MPALETDIGSSSQGAARSTRDDDQDQRGGAVEVAAMLGDSMVGVKHCRSPGGGRVTGKTKALLAAGALCLFAAAAAFALSVDHASRNQARLDAWLDAKRPAYAFRPDLLARGYDWLLFGGLALGLTSLAWGVSRLRDQRATPWYRIGTGREVELAVDTSPAPSFPLVAPQGDGFVLNFAGGLDGEMTLAGRTTPLGQLMAEGRARPSAVVPGATEVPLPPEARLRVRSGQVSFMVAVVAPPRRQAMPWLASLEGRVVGYFAASAGAHLGLWALLRSTVGDPYGAVLDMASEEPLLRKASIHIDEPAPPPPPERGPEGGDGASGTSMVMPAGTMGRPDATRTAGRFQIKKTAEQERLAREEAITAARNGGVLGVTAVSAAFQHISGSEDLASGLADIDIEGGLVGDEPGEMVGQFGSGRTGFGRGGDGNGWGISLAGRYGTIDSGEGTGGSYGAGIGSCRSRICGGRRPKVPSVQIGDPIGGGPDKSIIRRYIKRHISKVTYCYEKQLYGDPGLAGVVETQFFIGPSGVVQASTARGVNDETARCIAGVIKGIAFPAIRGGGGVQVSYPFTFRPTGG